MSVTRLDQYEQHFLISNRLVRFVLGITPNQNANLFLFQLCTLFTYLLPIPIIQFYQSFMMDIQVKSDLISIQKVLSGTCVFGTYSICYFRSNTVRKLFACTTRNYKKFLKEEESWILEKYTKQIKLYTIIFTCFFILYAISLTFPSIFNVFLHKFGLSDDIHLTLPFPVKNILNSGLLYYSLLIYQIIAIFAILIISSVIYPSFLVIVQHACLQLKILMIKIRQPFNEKRFKANYWSDRSQELEWEWIVDIINRYAKVTKYVYLINNLTKIIFLLGASFMLLLMFFDLLWIMQLSVILQNTRDTIECFICIVGSMITVSIIFYSGQTLINHSIAVFDELCQIPFYVLSKKTQKLLQLLIARNIRPCELSIGGLLVASHETFSSVLQKALSFASVYYNTL